MNIFEAINHIKAGGRCKAPGMNGAVCYVEEIDGEPVICLRSENGKVIKNWLPASLLSGEWQPVDPE